eukprot:TRINITY_DN2596_c2_g1_i2.p7 TRINITY_DN2596_c2_g1~~TRINITY_DN2596_c2_g1_i2.p7  ORF type:complete len:100 (-),score=2.64 TRINITY_DN2596_c2_g1_i2:937-1236(-)
MKYAYQFCCPGRESSMLENQVEKRIPALPEVSFGVQVQYIGVFLQLEFRIWDTVCACAFDYISLVVIIISQSYMFTTVIITFTFMLISSENYNYYYYFL